MSLPVPTALPSRSTSPQPTKDNDRRYMCILDLAEVKDKKRVVLHLPNSVFARLCKSNGDDDVHIYLGQKKQRGIKFYQKQHGFMVVKPTAKEPNENIALSTTDDNAQFSGSAPDPVNKPVETNLTEVSPTPDGLS